MIPSKSVACGVVPLRDARCTVCGACEALEVGNVLDRIREMTGIYGLGFRRESILGLAVPIVFVILVGGAIAGLILLRP
jgi:hypothetical protein